MMRKILLVIEKIMKGGVIGLLFLNGLAIADDRDQVEKLSVLGSKEALPTRPGSAHIISEEEMDKFDYIDVHRLLRSVPGVNVMDEDGFGLRPNIGLRGGHPERSKKITLMEDGVLIAPAPYSAPAAYYFPQMDKISSIEVFKGVPSTAFGPNSMGGAINMTTGYQPKSLRMSAWGGQFGFQKYDLAAGFTALGDWSINLNRISSRGFKTLENGGDTGFERNNVTLRWDKQVAYLDQHFTLKFNWSDELSNETYAGTSKEDFERDPYLRYNATERDVMNLDHRQFFASYAFSPIEDLRWRTTFYRHELKRGWDKLVGFGGNNPNNPSVDIRDVMRSPSSSANEYYYQVLTGQADSSGLSDDRAVLELGDNQRQYLSQGVQTQWTYDTYGEETSHLFKLFYRLHQDEVNRFHESEFWNMTQGRLERNNSRSEVTTTLNKGSASTQTLSLAYENNWRKVTTQGILRYEDIRYDFTNFLASTSMESSDELFASGLGLFYQAFDQWGVLAGVNNSFNPVGPGQPADTPTEEAINYELGVRFTGGGDFGFEFIGFYSDYRNLNGTCTQSGGCTIDLLDTVESGGKSVVYGTEFLLSKTFRQKSWSFPILLNTTYTIAEFRNSFATQFPEWGDGVVQIGDPIPYIPEWQAQLSFGVQKRLWSFFANFHYLGRMADQAVLDGRQIIPERLVLGLSTAYVWSDNLKLRFRVDNITNERFIASFRPFGARPGRPMLAMLGVEYSFF